MLPCVVVVVVGEFSSRGIISSQLLLVYFWELKTYLLLLNVHTILDIFLEFALL